MAEQNTHHYGAKLIQKDAEFFCTILRSLDLPIFIIDAQAPDNPIVFVNQAFEIATGYSWNEAIGRNYRFLQDADQHPPSIDVVALVITRGEPSESMLRPVRKDGKQFWNRLSAFPIRDQQGAVTSCVAILHDVSMPDTAKSALEDKQILTENSIDAYLKINADGTILEANKAVLNVFGWEPEEIVGTSAFLWIVPEERVDEARVGFAALFSQPHSQSVIKEYKRKDGTTAIVEWTLTTGHDKSTIICIGRDITQRRLIEQEAARANQRIHEFLNSITEGFYSIDRQWRFTYINTQGAKWLCRHPEDLIGKNVWQEFPELVDSPFYHTYRQTMELHTFAQCDAYYPPLDAWFEARVYPSAEGITTFFMNISERKKDEETLIYSATHDLLTGLFNRNNCLKILNERLASGTASAKPVALLFIDLDRFKEINDAFGHRAGDQVLAALGRRLAGLAGNDRFPARISGDEFVFILIDKDEDEARKFATDVLKSIVEPVLVTGIEVAVGASIGIAIAGDNPIAADDLINRADTAMYAAKAAGRHTVSVFSEEIDTWSKRRLQLRHEILPALHAGQFVLHYQPQVRLADDAVVGAEALIRWQHPQLGLLSPAAFIDLAEESPLIIELGAWVFDKACRQLSEWEKSGRHLTMSINVSARQLSDPDLPLVMETSIQKYAINPQSVKLEVTESMLAQDFHVSAKVLGSLKEKGFEIALDDFGTGYSNLAYINRFPVGAIKIDRSFIIDLECDQSALALVNGIIALAKSLQLTVICEGIETQAQRSILESTQCDMIQGYLVSKPVPAQEFFEFFLWPDKKLLTQNGHSLEPLTEVEYNLGLERRQYPTCEKSRMQTTMPNKN